MSSLPTSEPPSKGLWLTSREIDALTAAEESGNLARRGLSEEQGARAASAAQSENLRATSWRARFMALAAAVLQPELVDPQSLAMVVIQAAPSARAATIPDEDVLVEYDEAARRFFARACTADQTGLMTVTLTNDEARELAITLLDLVEAVRDLA